MQSFSENILEKLMAEQHFTEAHTTYQIKLFLECVTIRERPTTTLNEQDYAMIREELRGCRGSAGQSRATMLSPISILSIEQPEQRVSDAHQDTGRVPTTSCPCIHAFANLASGCFAREPPRHDSTFLTEGLIEMCFCALVSYNLLRFMRWQWGT
jgi:hypothetical protein